MSLILGAAINGFFISWQSRSSSEVELHSSQSQLPAEKNSKRLVITPTIDIDSSKRNDPPSIFLLPVLVVVLLSATAAASCGILLDTSDARKPWWVAMLFGPVGATIRYLLSIFNHRFNNFPLFTFIANVSASTINMVILVVGNDLSLSSNSSTNEHYALWVQHGLSTGCMGSLSTVSTWVNEIRKFAERNMIYAYRYAIVSLLSAQILCLLIGGIWISTGHVLQ